MSKIDLDELARLREENAHLLADKELLRKSAQEWKRHAERDTASMDRAMKENERLRELLRLCQCPDYPYRCPVCGFDTMVMDGDSRDNMHEDGCELAGALNDL